MTGLIFSTFEEARPFLDGVAATKIADERFETHEFSTTGGKANCIAVICGMGMERAAQAAGRLLTRYRLSGVINAGICGAAAGGVRVGDVFRVTQARIEAPGTAPEDWPAVDCGVQLPLELSALAELPAARLTTVEEPVFDEARRELIGRWGQLIDMEGAVIAGACVERKMPFCLVKGVSDFADEQGKRKIQENIRAVSREVAKCLIRALCPVAEGSSRSGPLE